MLPDFLYTEPQKSFWSHTDSFGGCFMENIKAFIHKNYSIGMHTHEFYEINIVLNGTGRHYIEQKFFDIEKGCVFIIPPHIRHGYLYEEPLDIFHILINNEFMNRYNIELTSMNGYKILFEIEPYLRSKYENPLFLRLENEQFEEILKQINSILGIVHEQSDHANVVLNIYVLNMILCLCCYIYLRATTEGYNPSNLYNHAILICLEYLHNHYPEKITLEDLSDYCHLSRSTLLRYFQLICKCSPLQYLIKFRLIKARSLMRLTDITLAEIALKCGFFDQAHLTKSFIKEEHITPVQFRKNIII